MNSEYVKLENEIRAEIMLRKTGKRSEKYKHLADSEVLLLGMAMTNRNAGNLAKSDDAKILNERK